jgi:hypothetical protein
MEKEEDRELRRSSKPACDIQSAAYAKEYDEKYAERMKTELY